MNNISPKRAAFYKWELLLLLWLAFFFNQADRQIFNVVLPLVKAELKFSDTELGLIASALIWAYGLLVPVAGFAGDFISKKKIIVLSLMFWSTATLFTGLGSTLLYFIVIRGIATGGGEAFYAPAANTLISTQHKKTRSFALSLHQSAVYFGIILSGWLAGYIAERFGWRTSFYAFGGFGVLLAITIQLRLLREGPREDESLKKLEALVVPVSSGILKNTRTVFKTPSFWLLTAAFACMVFVNTGYLTWMPSFLYEKYHLSLSDAGFSSMFYHHAGAFAGVLLGGRISDSLAAKKVTARPLIQLVGLLAGAPFIYFMAKSDSLAFTYLSLALFGFFRGVFDCNIFGSLFDVIEERFRSTASGLMLMIAFMISAAAPVLLGLLKPSMGLGNGLSLLSLSYLLGAVFLGIGIRFFYKYDFKVNTIN